MPLVFDDEIKQSPKKTLVFDDEISKPSAKIPNSITELAKSASQFLTSPRTTPPLVPDVKTPFSPFSRVEALRIPEEEGSKVKRLVQDSLSNIARTPTQN